jgi:hypothetical protein
LDAVFFLVLIPLFVLYIYLIFLEKEKMNSKGVKMPSIRERRRPLDRFLEVIVEEDLDYFDVVPAIQANQNITALSFIIILFIFVRQLFLELDNGIV